MKEYIFFDIDWVIVSSVPFYANLIKNTLLDLWAKNMPEDIISLVWMDSKETISYFFPKERYSEVYEKLEKALEDSKDHKPDLVPWSIETLKHIKEKNIKTAAVTSRSRVEINGLFSHYKELNKLFDYNISRTEVENIKPNPEPLYKALDFFNIKPHEAVFIWDSKHDFWAAKAANMQFYWVCTWVLNPKDWEKLNTNYLNDVSELIKCEKFYWLQ